jgi:hypothetical protein
MGQMSFGRAESDQRGGGGGRFRLEKDIKIRFRVTAHEGRKWILLAKGRVQRQEIGNTVLNLPVAKSSEMF